MDLLERLRRRRPDWESPDAAVRAEAVLHVPADQPEVLERLAREDEDPHVRRAAVRRLGNAAALAALVAGDADEGVRVAATERLSALAMGHDAAEAEAALASLTGQRDLAAAALAAALPGVRLAAVRRLDDARLLARVARSADDAAVRQDALNRTDQPELLRQVASGSEFKDVAVAAVDRLADVEALRSVVSRAHNRAAARLAATRLQQLEPNFSTEPAKPAPLADNSEASMTSGTREPPAEVAPGTAEVEPDRPEPHLDVQAAPHEDAAPAEGPVDAQPPGVAEETIGETASSRKPGLVSSQDARGAAEASTSAAAVASSGAGEAQGGPPGPAAGVEPAPGTPPAVPPPLSPGRRDSQARGLCDRLEALVRSPELTLREADAALRGSRTTAQELGALPGKLTRRLRAARASLFARLQELREAEEWGRWGNAAVQEELCRRMESLQPREDLAAVARELRELDALWAQWRLAPKDEAETLRHRYQAARAVVSGRLEAWFAERAAREAANRQLKQALCERAEALADSTRWKEAAEELKSLQARWKEVGPIRRREGEVLWTRFRAACDRFFTRRQEDLKKRKQEWARNLERKEALCARVEALHASEDWEATAAEVRRLQHEWKQIGPVRRVKAEALWQRFHKAADGFFERYRNREALDRATRVAEREAVCRALEDLAAATQDGQPPEDLAQQVLALTERARRGPSLPPAEEESLGRRLREARDRLVVAFPASFRGTELDAEGNRTRKEKLCARVEGLFPGRLAEQEPLSSAEALARRLKEALASNTIGRTDEAAEKRRAADEVKAARVAWERIGPVPGPEGAALDERFRRACARVAGERPARRPPLPATTR